MTITNKSSAGIVVADAAIPGVLNVVTEIVASANSGGGRASLPDLQLNDAIRLAQLTPASLAELLRPYVGPSDVPISCIVRLPAPAKEAVVFVGGVHELPFVLKQDLETDKPDKQHYPSGSLLIRRDGRPAIAVYDDVLELMERVAQKAYKPDSAVALVDVTLARRGRNPSALLDRMDLLWCLIERDSIEFTASRLELLLRSSLRRTPTLYFWLAEFTDSHLIEQVLLTSVDDEDRDISDAKDSILEVAALFASDATLQAILDKMHSSAYAHFQQAATDWPGRRAILNAFEQRTSAGKLDGSPATDWSLPALYNQASETALTLMTEGRSGKQLGDIGRAIFCLRSPGKCST